MLGCHLLNFGLQLLNLPSIILLKRLDAIQIRLCNVQLRLELILRTCRRLKALGYPLALPVGLIHLIEGYGEHHSVEEHDLRKVVYAFVEGKRRWDLANLAQTLLLDDDSV